MPYKNILIYKTQKKNEMLFLFTYSILLNLDKIILPKQLVYLPIHQQKLLKLTTPHKLFNRIGERNIMNWLVEQSNNQFGRKDLFCIWTFENLDVNYSKINLIFVNVLFLIENNENIILSF